MLRFQLGHACLPTWGSVGSVAKILSPLEVARQPTRLFAAPPVIQIHHFGYITSWSLRNSSSASLLSQHCLGAPAIICSVLLGRLLSVIGLTEETLAETV
jgi:hypothetical protein